MAIIRTLSTTDHTNASLLSSSDDMLTTKRRLAAFVGKGFLGVVKDKNWSPFMHDDRLLWIYSFDPFIICENDVDLRKHNVDCVICERKYSAKIDHLMVDYSKAVKKR